MTLEVGMATIYIELTKVQATLNQQMELEHELESISKIVSDVRSNLRNQFSISSMRAIDTRLRQSIEQINKKRENIQDMRVGLEQIISRYKQTENGNFDYVNVAKTAVQGGENGSSDQTDQTAASTNEIDPNEQFLAIVKSVLSWADKAEISDNAGLGTDGLSYLESLYKFFTGDKKGLTGAEDLFDLGDKSASLWTGLYDYLKDFYHGVGDTFSIANQKNVAGLGIAGGFLGLISSAFSIADQVRNNENIGTAGMIGEIIGGGDSAVDIWSGIEKLIHVGDKTTNITTSGASGYSPLTIYSSIAKGYISAFSQGFKSYEQYAADGAWDAGDTGRTGIEFSVTGIYSMISALSFGLISEETTGVSAESISKGIEDWASNLGKSIGNWINNW